MVPVPEAISPGDLPCARTTAASLRGRMASGQASPPLGLVSSCSSLPHFPQVVVGYAGNTYILTMALTGVKRNEVPVRIYELPAPRGGVGWADWRGAQPLCRGLVRYRRQEWEKALRSFKQALEIVPENGPARILVERCRQFMETPPPASWDGVYRFTGK